MCSRSFLTFIFISLMGCAHQKNHDVGRTIASAPKAGCFSLMKDVLATRTPQLQAKRILEKIDLKLNALTELKGDAFFKELKEVEEELHKLKSFAIQYGSDEEAQKILSYFVKLNELRVNPQFQKGQFNFQKLKALIQKISKTKRLDKLNNDIREEILTEKKIGLLKSYSVDEQEQSQVLDQIAEITFLREVHPPKESKKPIEWDLFKAWVITRNSEIPTGQYNNLGELYDDFFNQFQNAVIGMKKKQKTELLQRAKITHFEKYNKLQDIQLKDLSGHDEFITKAHLLISSYSTLDPSFRGEGFFNHLSKNSILNEDFFNKQVLKQIEQNERITLGDVLNQKYGNFAPYAINNSKEVKKVSFPKRVHNNIKRVIGKAKADFRNCDSISCYLQSIRNNYLAFTKGDFYSRNFNCLASNPFIIKSLVMDFSIITGSLIVYYFSNDDMERFPWEIVANNMIFSPIMGEANCRASFKSPLNFGEVLAKEEVFASRALKAKRFTTKLTDLSLKGGMATLGLMTLTYGFDHLYLALGHEVANPKNLLEMAQVLPFMFTYYAIWNNVKGLVVQNPIRHKLIPKIAKIFEQRTKIKGSYIYTQTGLDLAAFYYLSMYHNWEYLTFYQNTLEPWWRRTIGLDDSNQPPQSEVEESDDEIKVTTAHPNGIKSEAVFHKTEKNTIQLKAIDLDIPTPILEEYIEKSLMP